MKTQHPSKCPSQRIQIRKDTRDYSHADENLFPRTGILMGWLIFLPPHSAWVFRSLKGCSRGFQSPNAWKGWILIITLPAQGACVSRGSHGCGTLPHYLRCLQWFPFLVWDLVPESLEDNSLLIWNLRFVWLSLLKPFSELSPKGLQQCFSSTI